MREAVPVAGQGLEDDPRIEVALLQHEDRVAAHAMEWLAHGLAVLAR